MKIKFFFAWFDFWVGFYYDQKGHALYVCPLPCCVFKFWRSPTQDAPDPETGASKSDSESIPAVSGG